MAIAPIAMDVGYHRRVGESMGGWVVDLRQLRYFVAVADEGSIRKASYALYVAQPSVSVAIRQLETELQTTLLHRSHSGVELTTVGAEFLAHARHILDAASEARKAVRQHSDRALRTLRVGLLEGTVAAAELTAPIIEGYRERHPDVHVKLEYISFCDQTSGLLSEQVDVALVRPPLDHRELEVVPIAAEPRALWVGTQHDLAGESEVCVDDILDEATVPLGAPEEWSSFWQLDDARGGGRSREDVGPSRTIGDIQLAVADGSMVITAPRSMLRLLHSPLLHACDLSDAALSVIAVAHRRDDRRGLVRDFVEHAGFTAEECLSRFPGGTLAG